MSSSSSSHSGLDKNFGEKSATSSVGLFASPPAPSSHSVFGAFRSQSASSTPLFGTGIVPNTSFGGTLPPGPSFSSSQVSSVFGESSNSSVVPSSSVKAEASTGLGRGIFGNLKQSGHSQLPSPFGSSGNRELEKKAGDNHEPGSSRVGTSIFGKFQSDSRFLTEKKASALDYSRAPQTFVTQVKTNFHRPPHLPLQAHAAEQHCEANEADTTFSSSLRTTVKRTQLESEGQSRNPLSLFEPLVNESQSLQFGSDIQPVGSRRKRSFEESGPMQNPQISSSMDRLGSKKRSVLGVQTLRSMLTGVKKRNSPQCPGDKGEPTHSKATRKPSLQHSSLKSRKISSSSALAEQAAALVSSSIICHDIPVEMRDKAALRNHFSQFGEVLRVLLNEGKNTATVTFKTHEMAATAKREGAYINECVSPMRVFFKRTRKSSEKASLQRDFSTDFSQLHQPVSQTKEHPPSYSGQTRKIPAKVSNQAIYARTDEEKLELLEKIDKLLRKQVVRQSDIRKAETSKGTCPDMCPEKERYLRQQRKLLAIYEMDGGLVDHFKAIKEYSRSSADQDEPLPHELRPSSVLRMTMHHLLSAMMPRLSEGQTAEWYDFIWNRTRAIRKELTIQQISDITAININEQCARFHIFCAHQLCGEDRMVFDPKINNENLEKTMKTVMDLYQEMLFIPGGRSVDFARTCSNVAELYGYYILLNINKTADVLNELQELPIEVRSSPDIGIAVEAFMAVHSNNYTKFFKVVKRATFLQGCILHRYFTQVRRKAALTIAKAFVAAQGKKIVNFPVDDFVRILCFNDIHELQLFCEHFGIALNGNVLELNRSGLEEKDTSLHSSPSHLVLSKAGCLNLAEVIAKCALEPENYMPYSSFDEKGRYIGEHFALLRSQKVTDGFQALRLPGTSSEEMPTSTAKMLPPGVTNNHVKMLGKDLFHEVISEMSLSVANEILEAAFCSSILRGISDEVVGTDCLSIASQVIEDFMQQKRRAEEAARILEEEKKMKELKAREEQRQKELQELEERRKKERAKQEAEEMKLRQTEILAHEMLLEAGDEIIKSVAEQEHKELTWKYAIEKKSKEELSIFMDEVLASMTNDICSSVWKELKKLDCAEIYDELKLRQLKRAFKKWLRVKALRLKFQSLTESFPNMPFCRTLNGQIKALLPSQRASSLSQKRFSFPLDVSTELSLQSPMEMVAARKRCKTYFSDANQRFEKLYRSAALPLPFCDMLKNAVQKPDFSQPGVALPQNMFWKIGLRLPASSEGDVLHSWLRYAFIGENRVCSTYRSIEDEINVTCCILSSENLDSSIKGAFGIVLALQAPKQDLEYARAELENLISSRPAVPLLPLLIVLLDWEAEPAMLDEKLELASLNSAFSRWAACSLKNNEESILENYQALLHGVEFLFREMPRMPSLTSVSMREFFEDALAREYVTPLYRHVSQRREARMQPLEPNAQINFFNFIVDALASAVSREEFSEISWPPEEFSSSDGEKDSVPQDWNLKGTLTGNYKTMQACKVPSFIDSPVLNTEKDILDTALAYAACVSNSSALASTVMQRVAVELERIADDFPLTDDPQCPEEFSLKGFDWHLVIDCIISQHLTDILYHCEKGSRILTFPADAVSAIKRYEGFEGLLNESEFDATSEQYHGQEQQSSIVEDMFSNLEYSLPHTSISDATWLQDENPVSQTRRESEALRDKLKREQMLSEQHNDRLEALIREGDAPLGILGASEMLSSLFADSFSVF